MPPTGSTPAPEPVPGRQDPLAGLLSYAVPGLGQIKQGRVGKGLLFLVCVHVLFIYGMALGHWKNVYLPKRGPVDFNGKAQSIGLFADLKDRLQFVGQFWVGAAAWPAVYQYATDDKADSPIGDFMQPPSIEALNHLQREENKRWDMGWVFTVIAGVLNLLVIYDAFAGPAFRPRLRETPPPKPVVPTPVAVPERPSVKLNTDLESNLETPVNRPEPTL